ncbi:MAG: ParB/RepB/Spo0J family partition protein, partial [Planctomycetota bacterium]|nr:ParB/RepB/Spo0J family partition protein [Planctomycetota bacterium]
MSAERRLGRGLEALLGRPPSGQSATGAAPFETQPDVVLPEHPVDGDLLQVSVEAIDSNPYQPRTEFDEQEIDNLADSIKRHGLLQPIVVRRAGERYELISGERRWRASIRVGLSHIPATLREVDDRQVAELTIGE